MSRPLKLSSGDPQLFWEIPVVFEDEHLLALNKPPGLLTSPNRFELQRPSLLKLLHAGISEAKTWAREAGLTYLMNTHRLDPDTSGVLLFAKSKPAFLSLANQFGAEKVRRKYDALVQGHPEKDELEISARIAPDSRRIGAMRIDPHQGKRALTKVRVQKRFARWTLLECEVQAERPHQIRLHLRYVGFPLVGDSLYGGRNLLLSRLKAQYRLKPGASEKPLLERAALHAAMLSLEHPVTGQPLELKAEWAKDLKVAVKYLERFAGGPHPLTPAPSSRL